MLIFFYLVLNLVFFGDYINIELFDNFKENFIVISDDFFDEEVNIIKMLIGK